MLWWIEGSPWNATRRIVIPTRRIEVWSLSERQLQTLRRQLEEVGRQQPLLLFYRTLRRCDGVIMHIERNKFVSRRYTRYLTTFKVRQVDGTSDGTFLFIQICTLENTLSTLTPISKKPLLKSMLLLDCVPRFYVPSTCIMLEYV